MNAVRLKKRHRRWWLALPIVLLVAITVLAVTQVNLRTMLMTKALHAISPACGNGALLSRSPMDLEDTASVVPLGNFAPPGHILPTTHLYLTYKHNPDPIETTIYAPADLVITRIVKYDNGSTDHPFDSYQIEFDICREVSGYFIHLVKPSQKILDAFTPPFDIETSNVGKVGKLDHNYRRDVYLTIKAGEVIGTGGGASYLPDALDFALTDGRTNPSVANPERLKKAEARFVCPFDYLPAQQKEAFLQKTGDFQGKLKPAREPRCGQVFQDVTGTAQGSWYMAGSQSENDIGGHLALAHDNYDHATGVFALGNKLSQIGVSTDYTQRFVPQTSGLRNLDFGLVRNDGKVYCYDTDNGSGRLGSKSSLLVQMTGSATLRIGPHIGTCGQGPWQFGKYLDYVR